MNSGLMNGVIENMLYPVKYILETAGMGDLLTSAFKDMGALDINSLVGDLTKTMDLGIKLPELDIKAFGNLGTPTALTSKRTVNGAPAQYTYITADSPAVFLTILRYLVTAISMEENSGLLTGLMGSEGGSSAEGMPDMFAMYDTYAVIERGKFVSAEAQKQTLYNPETVVMNDTSKGGKK